MESKRGSEPLRALNPALAAFSKRIPNAIKTAADVGTAPPAANGRQDGAAGKIGLRRSVWTMPYYAHTAETKTGERLSREHWQPLAEHLRNVAERAGQFAAPCGLADEARLAGLLHDLGKYGKRFQQRLADPSVRGVNHWAPGAYAAWQSSRIAAFAVDGHHTGIPAARRDEDRLRCLANTLKDFQSGSGVNRNTNIAETVETLLKRLNQEGLTIPSIVRQESFDFASALRTRMLFSCLVDADFLDTENHFDPERARSRCVPVLSEEKAFRTIAEHLKGLSGQGSVNRMRRQLLSDCLSKAESPPGLFSLTAPTGSGKTLASLAFALKHCCHHNASLPAASTDRFRRIIVVIPYTSIIEQTAKVFRDLFEPVFDPDYVLEHHSAVAEGEPDSDLGRDAEDGRIRRARLAAENWSAPLVVTTSVQFFESLFAHKPSRCRKLHNIARSVVIFDEVQTLPPPLAPSLLSTVNILTRDYGVTAVFCTATQPAFATAAKAIVGGWNPREISSRPEALAEALKRTAITIRSKEPPSDWPDLAKELSRHERVLCVVNTRAQAAELFRLLPEAGRFHLSAAMCAAHRSDKLKVIRQRLEEGKTCRLVSTQLIEAGVDVDFPIAYRALGPLDSIIQTAGRCNREGRSPEPRPVIVFTPPSGGLPRGAYKIATQETKAFLCEFQDAQRQLHQPKTYRRYFSRLYGVLGPDSADDDCAYRASKDFDFPAAAQACQLIGDKTHPVLVPYGPGNELIETIRRQRRLTAVLARQCQRFTINLYESEFKKACGSGAVTPLLEDASTFFWSSRYDDLLGACSYEAEQFVL